MEKTHFKKLFSRHLFAISLLIALFSWGTASAIEPTEVQLDKLSFDQLQQAAQAGDPDAQYALGYMYYYGKSVPQNTQEALNWIKRASVQGQEQATKALALIQGQTQNPVTQPSPSTMAAASANAPAVQAQSPAAVVATNVNGPTANTNAPVAQAQYTAPVVATNTNKLAQQQPAANVPNTKASSAPVNTAQAKTVNTTGVPNTQNVTTAPNSSSVASTPVMAATASPVQPVVPSMTKTAPAVKPSTTASNQSASLATQEQHLLTIPSDYHTLQLIGSFNEQDVVNYIKTNGLQGKATYYRGDHKGKDWYVVLYGVYKTLPEAQAAITTLPEPLKKQSPWVRSLSAVQASIKQKMSA